jgi:hypothetical protein
MTHSPDSLGLTITDHDFARNIIDKLEGILTVTESLTSPHPGLTADPAWLLQSQVLRKACMLQVQEPLKCSVTAMKVSLILRP